MPWIRTLRPRRVELGRRSIATKSDVAQSALVQHVEEVSLSDEDPKSQHEKPSNSRIAKKYPFASLLTPDDELPFIPKEEVLFLRRPDAVASGDWLLKDRRELCIVLDNVVYNCTDFITEHPGGQQVILSFVGEDCSWQFWRFHTQSIMEQYGRELRVGRTEGVPNRFIEPPRVVGVCSIDDGGW